MYCRPRSTIYKQNLAMVNRIWPTAVAGQADMSASACTVEPNSVSPGQILLVYGIVEWEYTSCLEVKIRGGPKKVGLVVLVQTIKKCDGENTCKVVEDLLLIGPEVTCEGWARTTFDKAMKASKGLISLVNTSIVLNLVWCSCNTSHVTF